MQVMNQNYLEYRQTDTVFGRYTCYIVTNGGTVITASTILKERGMCLPCILLHSIMFPVAFIHLQFRHSSATCENYTVSSFGVNNSNLYTAGISPVAKNISILQMRQNVTQELDDQIVYLIRNELYVQQSVVDRAASELVCLCSGLSIMYSTALAYSSIDGSTIASTLVERILQKNWSFTIDGEALELITKCPESPSTTMAPQDNTDLPLYCETWIYSLLMVVAVVLGYTCGLLLTCVCFKMCTR